MAAILKQTIGLSQLFFIIRSLLENKNKSVLDLVGINKTHVCLLLVKDRKICIKQSTLKFYEIFRVNHKIIRLFIFLKMVELFGQLCSDITSPVIRTLIIHKIARKQKLSQPLICVEIHTRFRLPSSIGSLQKYFKLTKCFVFL